MPARAGNSDEGARSDSPFCLRQYERRIIIGEGWARWIMEIPLVMAAAMGVEEGSVIVLYPREGGMSYEVLPPPPNMKASVLETCEQFKEAFAEMKRLGD